MLRLNVMVFAFLAGSYLYAADLSSEFTQSKNAISVLGISSSFKTSEGSISGTGIGVEFSHSFTDRLTLDVSISTSLSAHKSVSKSFTPIAGYL